MDTSSNRGLTFQGLLILVISLLLGSIAATGCSNPMFNGFRKKTDSDSAPYASDARQTSTTDGWLTSLDEAKALSRQTGKPILMDFTGSDWCIYCKKLKREVFAKPEFESWARENVVLLEVDFPKYGDQSDLVRKQNEELKQQFKISSYPTVLMVDANDKVLGKMGYRQGGAEPWIQMASTQLPTQRAMPVDKARYVQRTSPEQGSSRTPGRSPQAFGSGSIYR